MKSALLYLASLFLSPFLFSAEIQFQVIEDESDADYWGFYLSKYDELKMFITDPPKGELKPFASRHTESTEKTVLTSEEIAFFKGATISSDEVRRIITLNFPLISDELTARNLAQEIIAIRARRLITKSMDRIDRLNKERISDPDENRRRIINQYFRKGVTLGRKGHQLQIIKPKLSEEAK